MRDPAIAPTASPPMRQDLLHQAAAGPEEGPDDDPEHDDPVERGHGETRGGGGRKDLV